MVSRGMKALKVGVAYVLVEDKGRDCQQVVGKGRKDRKVYPIKDGIEG